MDQTPLLTLVVPCFHEEPHFRDSVARVLRTLSVTAWTFEIIFVDDGSTDRTRELIREHCAGDSRCSFVFHETNKGRGAAFTTGFNAARGAVVGFIDIDLEVDSVYILPLVQIVAEGQADVATGNRYYFFSQLRKLSRYVLSYGYSRLCDLCLGSGLQDTETGIKFFNRARCAELVNSCKNKGWFWDTEVVTRAALGGHRIVEYPVLFFRRHGKKSTVRVFRDVPAYLLAMWRFLGDVGFDCFGRASVSESGWVYDLVARALKRPPRERAFATVAAMIPDGSSVVEINCKTARLFRDHLSRRMSRYLGVESNGSFVYRLRHLGIAAVFIKNGRIATLPRADYVVSCSGLQRFGDRAQDALAAMIAAAGKQVILAQRLNTAGRSSHLTFTFESFKALAEKQGASRIVSQDGGDWALAVFEGRA